MGDEYALNQPKIAVHVNDQGLVAINNNARALPQGSFVYFGIKKTIVNEFKDYNPLIFLKCNKLSFVCRKI